MSQTRADGAGVLRGVCDSSCTAVAEAVEYASGANENMKMLIQAVAAMAALISMGQCVATQPPFTYAGTPYVAGP